MSTSLARNTDPITSHQAAARAACFKASHADRILDGLAELRHATVHELSAHIGLAVVQIARRMPEMQSKGQVRLRQIDGAPAIRGGARVWEMTA